MTTVGTTLGVEEEYHLVDAETHQLADAPQVAEQAIAELGGDVQREISTSQVEVATPVLRTLAEVRAHVTRLRTGVDAVAQRSGCRILPAGTHPTAVWTEQRLTEGERYAELAGRWRFLIRQQLIAGCHVHVDVPDPELAVRVLDRLRVDLPVLLALSGSSPFWGGTDTGYASWRTQWFARVPVTGSPEVLGSRAAYDEVVRGLVATGMVPDASHLYWDARPSTRFPTIEVRVADMPPLLDDLVLQAGLSRSVVRAAAAEVEAGLPLVAPRSELVRAARWRAARDGLEGELVDLRTGSRRPAVEVVRALLARLRDDLEAAGEWDEVSALAEQALARGTSASRQRVVAEAAGGDLAAVTRSLVREALGE